MRYFITGGSGHLGWTLAQKISERGDQSRIFDLMPPPRPLPGLEFVKGDMTRPGDTAEACRDCDIVLHLAARVPQAMLPGKEFHRINVGGTRNILDAAIRNRVRRFVFASTIELYGPQPTSAPIGEEAKRLFTGEYSRNKWECEEMLREAVRAGKIEAVMLRMPLLLGPGLKLERGHLILFSLLKRNLPVILPSPPHVLYSAVSVEDAADAFLLAAAAPGANGEAMNIAAPDTPRALSVFRELARTVGSRSYVGSAPAAAVKPAVALAKRLNLPGLPAELLDYVFTGGAYSVDKARRVIGYAPRYTCVQALARAYQALQKSG